MGSQVVRHKTVNFASVGSIPTPSAGYNISFTQNFVKLNAIEKVNKIRKQ